MLQIGSGKLFTRDTKRINNLKGVLYTNLKIGGHEPINTAAGRLIRTDFLRGSTSIIYEYDEHMEETEDGNDFLISHGIDSFLNDMASIVSFGLNAICTTDPELTSRLISGQRSPAVEQDPKSILQRTFDTAIWIQDADREGFIDFANNLIRLQRKSFLGAMRAIRTYVTGIHRISDDLELAYTLIVASIESLAQEFDGHRSSWPDYEERKRRPIDQALAGANEDTARKVREALLQIEHTSLARRFRDFTISHTSQEFFREEATNIKFPIGRGELHQALQEAYRLRSRYVHNLSALPKIISMFGADTDIVKDKHIIMLTIAGLSRLARHVIRQFVYTQPKKDVEIYDYKPERSNVVQVVLAPQYWIGNKSGLNAKAGNSYLEGFLEQFSAAAIEKVSGASITDLRDILTEVEMIVDGFKFEQRRPYVALYFLFNYVAPVAYRSKNVDAFWLKYHHEISSPSIESLIVHLVMGREIEWDLSEHERIFNEYMNLRFKRGGIRISRSLETGLALNLAERYRIAVNPEKVRYLISLSVDEHPGNKRLMEFETEFHMDKTIDWRKIMYSDPEMQIEDYSI